ncbi:MAG: MBL fold metallo-hydrolase, partial [Desulfatitalea sp.]|nr:MBL fold metallo-hydrolase [Desulfatitalea sp.]NNJ99428.1 MBL fold metallo-hydrolase [Desulfatitalea sp.]
MLKKLIKSILLGFGLIAVCVGILAGWLFYQLRGVHHIGTAKLSDSLFVIKGRFCNLYLVKTQDGYIAFDAGDNPKKIIKECESLSINPSSVQAVFLTHSDADHVDGLTAFSSAEVYISRDEVPLLKGKNHRHLLGIKHMNKLPVSNYQTLSDGDVVEIGGIMVHAIATPGHTQGSMSFRVNGSLFTGDLCLIVNGQIRPMATLFSEDIELDAASIRKIARITDINQIFTAHTGYTA